MLSNHRDVQYIREHLTEEIVKKLKEYLTDGKFNINIEQVVNEYLNNNDVIKGVVNDINTDIKDINTQLKNIALDTEINLLKYGFKFDGTDESEKLNNLLSSLKTNSVTLVFPQGKTITLKNITFPSSKFLKVKGNNCNVKISNNDYVFVNNNNTMLLNVEDLVIVGDGGLCNYQLNSTGSVGTKLYARNIEFKGTSRTAIGINMQSTDFMNIENIIAYNMDTVIKINSNVTNGERTNTQINIRNLNIHTSNVGMYLNGVDKLNCSALDCNRVSSGIIIHNHVTRASFTNYHVEYFGNYGINSNDGYGVLILGRANKNIKFNESSIILPSTNAKYGIYMDDDYTIDNYYNQVKFDNMYVQNDIQNGYVPIKLSGLFEYNGNVDGMDGSKIILNTTNNKTSMGIIKPTDNYSLPFNVFNKSTIDSDNYFDLLEGGKSDITINDTDTLISNNSGSISKLSRTIKLSEGWYTAIINGFMNNNKFKVEMKNSPWTNIINKICYTNSNIIYFYIPSETMYKIQLEIADGSEVNIYNLILKKGFSYGI